MNKKCKNMILLIAIVSLIILGSVFIFLLSEKNSAMHLEKKINDEKNTGINDKFYYDEILVLEDESYFNESIKAFHKYKGDIVKLNVEFKLNDDNVIIADKESAALYNLTADKKVMKIQENIFVKDFFTVNENLNFTTVHYSEAENEVYISEISKDGKIIDEKILQGYKGAIHIGDNGSKFANVVKIEQDNDYYYIHYYSGKNYELNLQVFKKDGTPYSEYECVKYFDIDFSGNIFMYVQKNGMRAALQKVNLSEPDKIIFSKQINKCRGILYSKNENKIYCVEDDAVFIYANQNTGSDTSDKTNILTFGEASTFFLDDNDALIVSDFKIDDNNSIYMSIWNIDDEKGNTKYYKFNRIPGERPEREVTLTVTSPYRQDFLASAILRYEMANKDQNVKYDYTYNTREEFIKNVTIYGQKLTSKILVGDIGDIVMTGGSNLVYKDLFRTDAFIDLSEFIENDKNYSKINKKAVNSIKIQDKICGIPISIMTPYLTLNKTLAERIGVELNDNITWKDALDILPLLENEGFELYLFTSNSISSGDKMSIILNLLISNMPDLIDLDNRVVDLKQEWFIDLIEKYKKAMNSENFFKPFDTSIGNRIDQIDNALFAIEYMGNYTELIMYYVKESYESEVENLYIPMFSGEVSSNRVSYTNNMYSINAKSENKDAAMKFLSFLIEEDMQYLLTDYSGNPINLEAQKTMFLKQNERLTRLYPNSEYADIFINSIDKINSKIDYLYDMDYMKKDILDELELYFNDELSLEKALERAEEKIFIRLNE